MYMNGEFTVDGYDLCICAKTHVPYPRTTCAISGNLVVRVGRDKCVEPDGGWIPVASAYDGRINASATGRASSAEVELARALASSCAAPSGGAYIYGGWSARHGVLGDLWEYVGGRGKR